MNFKINQRLPSFLWQDTSQYITAIFPTLLLIGKRTLK